MKVLLFNSLFYPNLLGGAERSVWSLASGLVELGVDVAVVSVAKSGEELSKEIVGNGICAYYVSHKSFHWPFGEEDKAASLQKKIPQKLLDIYNFRLRKIFRSIFDDFSPDIVHTNNLKGLSVLVWSLAKLYDCYLVHTLRDYYLECSKCTKRNAGQNCSGICNFCAFYSFPKKRLSDLVDCVVGVSEYILCDHLSNGYFKSSESRVVYNGVEPACHISKNFLPNGKPVLGYLGRLEVDKGAGELLLLLERLSEFIDFEFVVAGDGDVKIINKIKNFKFANFLGKVSVADFFPRISFLLVPSLWNEPMGRVVAEAYMYGVPVVVNSVGGLPELVDPMVTGVVTQFSNFDRFKSDVLDILSKPYEVLSLSCLQKAKDFEIDHMVSNYMDIYERGLS